MAKITVEQLMAKMSDLGTDEAELAKYFIVDEDASGAFAPRLQFNPDAAKQAVEQLVAGVIDIRYSAS